MNYSVELLLYRMRKRRRRRRRREATSKSGVVYSNDRYRTVFADNNIIARDFIMRTNRSLKNCVNEPVKDKRIHVHIVERQRATAREPCVLLHMRILSERIGVRLDSLY